ncbi:hypothetical protein D3C83_318620 [compost metagenome]
MGLFWLTVACLAALLYVSMIHLSSGLAPSLATEDERAIAFNYLVTWMKARRR